MKDRKVRKRYPIKMYVVKLHPKDTPYKFLANYYFFRSKRAADMYTDIHTFPSSNNIITRFTIGASSGKELILFLRNVTNAINIAHSNTTNPLVSLRDDVGYVGVNTSAKPSKEKRNK